MQDEVATGRGQAVVDDADEQQRVDVAAGDNDADCTVAGDKSAEYCGERDSTSRLDHLFRPFEQHD